MSDVAQAESVPRWVWMLLRRLIHLDKGKVYRVTLITAGNEPSWTIEEVSRLENWREQSA
jgi:hypothetical protein